MPNTQELILDYMHTHRDCTVRDLARAYHLTPQGIRHHLDILVDQGILIRKPMPSHTRGRPEIHYTFSLAHQPDNHLNLIHALLTSQQETGGPGGKTSGLREIAVRLGGSTPDHLPPLRRLNQAMEVLNRQAYRARWEAGPAGPTISFAHCPYAAILPQHPEMCALDVYLLEHLLGIPVQQIVRQSLDPAGPPNCIFIPD